MKSNRLILCVFAWGILSGSLYAQAIPYGTNDAAAHRVHVGDANIYYEVYGEGRPVVLLHGGYAYIDQFKDYIPVLSQQFQVIVVAQRGYGRSEIGSKPFSNRLCADDVKAIIQKESREKAVVIGFSSGAVIGYIVAHQYPEIVHSVVSMGGPFITSGSDEYEATSLSETFEYYRPEFKDMMPQPERWNDFVENIALMWNAKKDIALNELTIKCPVLLLFGDRDPYCRPEHVVEMYRQIPHAQLAIFPNASHLDVSPSNPALLEQHILKFIK